jgi:hypothetical protein
MRTFCGLWCQPSHKDLFAAGPLLVSLWHTGLGINLQQQEAL